MQQSRRRILAGTAGMLAAGALAGCLGDDEEPEVEAEEGHDDDHDDDHDDGQDDDGRLSIGAFEIYDRNTEADDVLVEYHAGHWDFGPLRVENGSTRAFDVYVEDSDGTEIPVGDDEEYTINATFDEEANADEIVDIEPHGDHLDVTGTETGETYVILQLYHDDHSDWDSPTLAVEVVEDLDDEHDDGHNDGHDDEHDDDHEDEHDDE